MKYGDSWDGMSGMKRDGLGRQDRGKPCTEGWPCLGPLSL